jgi:acyl-CoA thioesterase
LSNVNPLSLEQSLHLEGGSGRYHIELSRAWEIWGPNGGYLAALALRAAGLQSEVRRPASISCQFLSSPQFSAVEIEVMPLRVRCRSEAWSVQMRQAGQVVLQAMVRTTSGGTGPEHQTLTMPKVPDAGTLKNHWELWPDSPGREIVFWGNVEAKTIDQRTSVEPRSGPRLDWARFQPQACFEDPFVDAARSLILLDTWGWAAVHAMYPTADFIAPNLDVSVWFHHFSPASEWLLIEHDSPIAARGLVGVNGKVWDADGRLLATGGAQLCCLPIKPASVRRQA